MYTYISNGNHMGSTDESNGVYRCSNSTVNNLSLSHQHNTIVTAALDSSNQLTNTHDYSKENLVSDSFNKFTLVEYLPNDTSDKVDALVFDDSLYALANTDDYDKNYSSAEYLINNISVEDLLNTRIDCITGLDSHSQLTNRHDYSESRLEKSSSDNFSQEDLLNDISGIVDMVDMTDVPRTSEFKMIPNYDKKNSSIALAKQQSTPVAVKRKYVSIKDTENIAQISSKKYCALYEGKSFMSPGELDLSLNLHTVINLHSPNLNTNIYEIAAKEIDVDEEKLFRNTILREFSNKIEKKGLDRSLMNISRTYSNIRKYVLDNLYPYISEIILTTDIDIIPGLHLADIKHRYISNKIFFDKLQECCEKISGLVNKASHVNFFYMLQSYISFGEYKRGLTVLKTRTIGTNVRNIISISLKSLIVDTIRNFPQKIKSVIENFNSTDIRKNVFVPIHTIKLPRSFIRKVVAIYTSNKLMIKNKTIEVYNSHIRTKLKEELQKSVNLVEKVTRSLTVSIVESFSELLISDMIATEQSEHPDIVDTVGTDVQNFEQSSSSEKYHEINRVIRHDSSAQSHLTNYQHAIHKTLEENVSDVEQKSNQHCFEDVVLEKLKPKLALYKAMNICSIKLTTSIYEKAIDTIDIDEKRIFRDCVLEEFSDLLNLKNLDKSLIDISCTYSKVRKYVLNKVSPFINSIMNTANIGITHGMCIEDIKRKCISNKIFFDKLEADCKKIAKTISETTNEQFLNLLQSRIRFGSKKLFPNMKNLPLTRKNELHRASKILIINTIIGLPRKIKDAIEKFEQSKVSESIFVLFHGVHVDRSLIINVLNIYTTDKLMVKRNYLETSSYLVRAKLEEECRKSTILFEKKAISPSEYMVKIMTGYLLKDVGTITPDNQSKLISMHLDEKHKYANI